MLTRGALRAANRGIAAAKRFFATESPAASAPKPEPDSFSYAKDKLTSSSRLLKLSLGATALVTVAGAVENFLGKLPTSLFHHCNIQNQ